MKLLLLTSALLVSTFCFSQNADSLVRAALGERLQEYYKAIERESIDVQKGECDFLIESTSDSLLRQFVATDIYDHYLNSPVMGAENVAIYVYDRWFATRKVRMRSEADSVAAKTYAEFNRQSLIGEKAPAVMLESSDGRLAEIFSPGDAGKRYRVLYFYDTSCAKCKLETLLLEGLFAEKSYPADIYAVYVGDDRTKWSGYMQNHLTSSDIRHFWDPSADADLQRKYGVVKTPRLFLVSPDGTIIGRGLDVRALEIMLEGIFAEKKLEYGGPESEALFDGIFAASGGRPSAGEVKGIADYIYDRTLGRGDTLMFRQLAGDYLYYLASRSGEGVKEGLNYHLTKNIFDDNGVWKSSDDSLKVIGFAAIMKDLLSKAAPGTRIPHIRLTAQVYESGKSKEKKVYLDRLKGKENIIIFYTEGCEVCTAEKESAIRMTDSSDKVNVLMVNFDRIMADDPALASALMHAFDLSSLPYIIMTDKSGTILRRYVSLLKT